MSISGKGDRLASRLISAVLSAGDVEDRSRALGAILTANTPEEAAEAVTSIVVNACSRPDNALVFLTLIDWNSLREADSEWDWEILKDEMEHMEPAMSAIWQKIPRYTGEAITSIVAKTALTIEIEYILREEVLHGTTSEMTDNAAEITLRILESGSADGRRLQFELSSYPVSCRKPLKEVLSELDFIERSPGSWQYSFSEKMLETTASGKGLDAHRGSTGVSAALASRSAESLVKRLELLTRTMQMFPAGHPSIKPTITSFLGILNKFISATGQVALSIVGETVMVNDVTIRRKSKATEEFIRSLIDRKINSISFSEGTTVRDVMSFAELFNRPPGYIISHGGIAKLLESRNLETITVNRFHYELISGEEEARRSGHGLDRQETALEDAIFSELLKRLEKGESIDSMDAEHVGEALKTLLGGEGELTSQRGTLARFIAALDPTLLETGLLASEHVQRGMAWSAVRKIILKHLDNLFAEDADVRHEAADSLQNLTRMAVERGKDNTVLQIIEKLAAVIDDETDPDVLFRLVTMSGAILRTLMAHGMLTIAVSCAKVISSVEEKLYPDSFMEDAAGRAIEEVSGMLDSLDAAESLVQKLLSEDKRTSRLARQLVGMVPPSNLVYQLIEIFREDNRQLRARAYQMLRIMSATALPALYARLEDILAAGDTIRDGKSGRLIDGEWYCARNVIQVLRDIKTDSSRDILQRLCADSDPRIRKEGVLALSRVSKQAARNQAKAMLNDNSEEVAVIALRILGKDAAKSPALTTWISNAYDRNPRLAADIIVILTSVADQKGVSLLLAKNLVKVTEGIPFENRNIAIPAIEAIGRFGGDTEYKLLSDWLKNVGSAPFRKPKIDRKVFVTARKAVGSISSRLTKQTTPTASV